MKKSIFALIALTVLFLTGCAATYDLKENWVDDDDMQTILAEPNIQKIAPLLGTPVFTEYRGDTVEFVYNYRPHLYKSARNGREYKPNDKDRVDLWSERTELVGILVVNDRIIGLRPRADYDVVNNNTNVKSGMPIGLIIFGILATAGIVAIIIATE
jgi:hypothetical protein